MNELIEYTKKELELANFIDESPKHEKIIYNAVLDLIKTFSKYNLSGKPADTVRYFFNRLSDFKPISKLTFEDDEWERIGYNLYQNKRYRALFKENGKVYNIDAYYCVDEINIKFIPPYITIDGEKYKYCYVKNKDNIPVKPIRIDVINRDEDSNYEVIDKWQIEELLKYYELGKFNNKGFKLLSFK